LAIEHVVVVVMENLTFDALYGSDPHLVPVRLAPCCPVVGRLCDNGHRAALAGVGGPGCRCAVPASAAGWFLKLAETATLLTHCFSAVRGPSLPNHLMLMCADSPFVTNAPLSVVPSLTSVFDRLDRRGLPWKAYSGRADGGPALLPQLRGRPEIQAWSTLFEDARTGRLPALAWVIPPFALSGHPPMPWPWAAAFLSHVLDAIRRGPQWLSTLTVVVFDDWGGYYDHVWPPIVEFWEDGTPFRDGFRVPAWIFSAHTAPGPEPVPCTGLSLLKLAEEILNLEPLTFRDAEAPSLRGVIRSAPRDVPPLPLVPWPPAWIVRTWDTLAHVAGEFGI
jgi:phospholipase C